MSNLKACPFCGSENIYMHSIPHSYNQSCVIFLQCDRCKIGTASKQIKINKEETLDDLIRKSFEELITQWSRREKCQEQ